MNYFRKLRYSGAVCKVLEYNMEYRTFRIEFAGGEEDWVVEEETAELSPLEQLAAACLMGESDILIHSGATQ